MERADVGEQAGIADGGERGSHPGSKPGHPDDWRMVLLSAYPRGS
jgi:hypothetical protein